MGIYVADFETTTNPEDCRVWAYAISEVGNSDNIKIGTTIDDFMNWCRNEKENHKIFFHNLKFDSQFIMSYLFLSGFEHTTDKKDRKTGTFNTLISDQGLFYQIEVIFYKKGKNINKVVFQDSLKLIPLSVEAIAKAFKMPISKLKIDYDAHNNLPKGAPLTAEEEEYIKHDVKIVAEAIAYFHSQGLNKMTIGSCALEDYKKIISKKAFTRYYPPPKFHDDVKQSYKGGFTWLNPKFASKIIDNGIVFDYNSMYPSVMLVENLPFGTPIYFKGKYRPDPVYPLYTQMFKCQFQLKKGKIPTIQIKHGNSFKGNEYLTNSGNREVTLCLNNIDLELFYEQYDVFNEVWLSGWKFKSTRGLFKDYIEKWSRNKINAKLEENHGLYLISKLFLNSLYGKFGTDNKVKSKIPYLDKETGVIKYETSKEEKRDGIYVAMASFITSYARRNLILSAQKITDNYNQGLSKAQFVYGDTDSLHIYLNGEDEEEFIKNCGLNINPAELNNWKLESKFNKAKFLRQKCYIENSTEDVDNPNPEYELKITVAGMPKDCYKYVTFENFELGASYKGKKQPKNVKGGVVLNPIEFTLKE